MQSNVSKPGGSTLSEASRGLSLHANLCKEEGSTPGCEVQGTADSELDSSKLDFKESGRLAPRILDTIARKKKAWAGKHSHAGLA